ncbi:MAG: glycogen synthase GlgA [candidate division KSB1 bacterium]|nr:glycogen synthase GlgA [candidate division KSB1 bacterium]
MKILFVSPEVYPFAKTGGLADVGGALPPYIKKLGHDIRIILPGYGTIDRQRFRIRKVRNSALAPIQIGGKTEHAGLSATMLPGSDVKTYFVENDHYYDRPELYKNPVSNGDWDDNDQRFLFFNLAVLKSMETLNWVPDVIHCNDWQSSLIPLLLKTHYIRLGINSLLTIHNIAYQGIFESSFLELWDFPEYLSYPYSGIEYWGKVNLLKAGIVYADVINAVSPTYSHEIQQSEEYGCGLEGVLRDRTRDIYGILNGVDYETWSPETDSHIPHTFSKDKLEGKRKNKRNLLEDSGLIYDERTPLIGIISRLVDQKGFDLIGDIIHKLMKLNLQIIILGTGEQKYHKLFTELMAQYPKKLVVHLKFDNTLAHRIEAGSDIFLMPSKYEPCGLNQMYSLRYGTVPIVRKTGGLADTITEYNRLSKEGNGFVFEKYDSDSLFQAIKRALQLYSNKTEWKKLMGNGMEEDFSWDRSAREYVKIYETKFNKNQLLSVS